MTNVEFLFGYPVKFKDICTIYPPKVKDVFTTQFFSLYEKILTTSVEEIEDIYAENKIDVEETDPFIYLMVSCYTSPEFKEKVTEAFEFFVKEPVEIKVEDLEVLIGEKVETSDENEEEKRKVINKDNFFEFQNLIRGACGAKEVKPPDPDENPKIKAMKAKARYRDKIKAKKNAEEIDFGIQLVSICFMDCGINPLNIGELSYAIISTIMNLYQAKVKYETDISSLLAGADSKKVKPKYWIRKFED